VAAIAELGSLDARCARDFLHDCGLSAIPVPRSAERYASYLGSRSILPLAGDYRIVGRRGFKEARPLETVRFRLLRVLPLASLGADLPFPDARFKSLQHYRLVLGRVFCCHSIRDVYGLSSLSAAMNSKTSNHSLEPTAGRRTEKLKDDL
jgi:hypothetical protein